MPAPRTNPLKLNRLQCKTLVLLQTLAELPRYATQGPEEGETVIASIPPAHGDHFHLGPWIVLARDATGLGNSSVRAALIRRGLVRDAAGRTVLTAAGKDYETGMSEAILHGSDHD